MGESTGEENANLYIRGVNEGRTGELVDVTEMLAILDEFGEEGLRTYLVGVIEGQEEITEDEEDLFEENEEDGE